MKTNKYLFLMLLIALCSMNVTAQQRNILQVPDVTTQIGNAQLPVSIENTDEIIGVQFDLTLPKGVTAEQVGIIANRGDGHSVTVSQLSSGAYRVMLHSPQNRPLRGQSGVVMYLPITIPASFEGGSEHPFAISNAVLGKATGENVLTEAIAGSIRISKLPDLTVKNITCDEQMLNPGDHFVCSWQVENIGEIATGGGWSELVSLISEDGKLSKLVATIHCDDIIDASGIVSRQAEITLPTLLGIDGQARLQVRIVPDSNTGESTSAQGNNTLKGTSLLHINKILTLEMSPNRVDENSGRRIALRVNRSGRWTVDETFKLSATGDCRLSVPSSITIPAGQSGTVVYLTVTDNDVVDDTSVVTMSVEGNDYPAAVAHLTIDDNELPDLQVTASKSVVNEGETFQLTITTSHVPSEPLAVTLTSENDKRFNYPRQVTIPVGQTSVTVDVTAKDDDLPSETLSNTFTVSASRFNLGEVVVLLEDNDMPVLELTLTPNKIAEGAGPVSVAGTLRRTGVTTNKITVRLSDDSNVGLYFGTRELVLNKGVEEVNFNFGPIDNAQVDGDRTYSVTAAVWLSSCSCSAAGESAGSVSATLEVLDDDGPALTLTSSLSTIKEGGKALLTVGRNTLVSLEQPLTVHLSSDYDDNFSYEHTVTIPTGQQSVQVEITSKKNDVSGDTHTAVFTAQAEGFASATCWLMVTDQTLPDAVITNISMAESEVEAESMATISVTVVNGGQAVLPSQTHINIYVDGNTEVLRTLYTQEELNPGESTTITRQVKMATVPGNKRLHAVVNEEKQVAELSYNNNTSLPVDVRILSPYRISIQSDKSRYLPKDTVILIGSVAGSLSVNAEIEVYVINDGLRQTQTVTTDNEGKFKVSFAPCERQIGHFVVGACYPGEGADLEMSSFDVLGLKRTSIGFITCDVTLGNIHRGEIELYNPSSIALTNITASITNLPNNCELQFSSISKIDSGQKSVLSFTLTGKALTKGDDWQEMTIDISTSEGASLRLPLYYYCRHPEALLQADIEEINTTMVQGTMQEYSFEITNIGHGDTGTLSLSLPSWMKALSPLSLPSIGQGESTKIVLLLTPNVGMPLNVPIIGHIAVNCEHGNGLSLPFSIEPVADRTGQLIVDVCDVFTFQSVQSGEAPHVEGALVTLKHPVTGSIVAEGLTSKNGLFETEVYGGLYELEVTSDNHEPYSTYINIDAGRTYNQQVILSYKAVSIEWGVVETDVEDEYDITVITNFDTNVPMPVVIIDGPTKVNVREMALGESVLLHFTLTNKGLVNAEEVTFELPDPNDEWILEALAYLEPFTLSPQSSVTIPVLLTRPVVNGSRRLPKDGNVEDIPDILYTNCMAGLGARYKYLCNEDLIENRAAHKMAMGLCGLAQLLDEIFNGGGGDGDKGKPDKPNNKHKKEKEDSGDKWPGKNETICDHDVAQRHYDALMFGPGLLTGLPGIVGGAILAGMDVAQDVALDDKIPWDNIAGYVLKPLVKIGLSDYEASMSMAQKPLPWIYNVMKGISDWGELVLQNPAVSNIDWIESFDREVAWIVEQYHAFDNLLNEIFGNEVWYIYEDETIIPFWEYVEEHGQTNQDLASLLLLKPDCASEADVEALVNHLNRDIQSTRAVRRNLDFDAINRYVSVISSLDEMAQKDGYKNLSDRFFHAYNDYINRLNEASSSVCASVTLEIKHVITLTRPAYRGTLTVFNGHDSVAMTDARLNLVVKNEYGNIATAHEFQINAESLEGFGGEVSLTSGWTLEAQQTGKATVLFIPTKYAAPTEPVKYSFGGSLTYIDPFTGLEVTRDLFPVTLTVNPLPDLELTYLMQRDVYGDDPLTTDVVEPMEEAEFVLIINNKGNSEAKNVRMVTEHPKIIDNEKSLLIDFNIKSSQVNGEPVTLSFGQSVANNFGTIPAHSQAYAQWWLESSLLGHFTSYEVETTHVTNYGNADLSLVDTVTIHEMIHGFTLNSMHPTLNVPLRGYLVNDIADAEDLPDAVYFTDALQQELYIAQNGKIDRLSENEFLLNVMPSQAGWNYGSVTDPTHCRQKLTKIVRKSDGVVIPVDNIWQTDRTLRDGIDWLYENRLHFVGNISADGETFVLTFEPKPELELAVESYTGVPEDGTVLKEQLTTVTVIFNKPIKAETFTTEDITLYCQGTAQDASQIVIEKQNEQEYKLILNDASLGDGYYVLTVQTAGIEDNEGFNGSTSKQTSWIQYVDGKVALIVNVSPAEGGTVTPESGRFIYDSDVILKATPAEGYSFSKWMIDNETVSTDAEFTYHLYRNTELTALFKESVFTGLQPLEGDALHVTITPLPLRDNMFVYGNFKEIQHVSIYDMRGIQCLGLDNIQSGQGIYVSNLKTGIYYVQIVTDRGIYRTKVIKR